MRSRAGGEGLRGAVLSNVPVKIICLAVAVLVFFLVRITSLEERFIAVPLEVRVNDGFVVTSEEISSVHVTLRGDEEAVFRIEPEEIIAFADLTRFTREGVYRVAIEFTKRGSAQRVEPLEVKADPTYATITVEEIRSREAAVDAVISSGPPRGFELIHTTVTPDTVVIRGPRQAVARVDRVPTLPVDLSTRTEDVNLRVDLNLNHPSVTLAGETSVELYARIEAATSFTDLANVDIILLGLPAGLRVVSDPGTGVVSVQGAQLDLEALSPGDVFMEIDCSAIDGPGEYRLETRLRVPSRLVALGYEPATVLLRIEGALERPETRASAED